MYHNDSSLSQGLWSLSRLAPALPVVRAGPRGRGGKHGGKVAVFP